MHLIIFSNILTPRIKYIFNFIFKDILKAEVEFTGNSKYFLQSENVKLSYGDAPLGDELFFKNSALLLANKLEEISPKTTIFGEYLVPFPVKDSTLPFDVFAASFFIVTRYEEYQNQKNNESDFKALKSYQHKWKILDKPIIDEWALILKSIIKKKHPNFKFFQKTFTQQPTINLSMVPNAPEGFINRTKFVFSTVFSKENNYISSKIDRFTGMAVDNEKVLAEVNELLANKKISPLYFIDFPNVPLNYFSLNGVSKTLTDKSVGLLQPCLNSKEKTSDIKKGILRLKKIHPEQVSLISQQLEALKFPICYLNLMNAGFTSDYSMGYADTPGFRAGTCTPFNWYDLQLEKVTPLIINSYCLTDHLFEHMPIEAAKKITNNYIGAVKVVDGSFCSSWKIKSLSNHLKYKKLKTIFTEMLSYAGN